MAKLIDITGNKYGRLTVIGRDTERKTNSGSYWLCQCECGNIKSVKSSSLRRGEIESCGCLRNEKVRKARNASAEDLTGRRFGKLVVLERDKSRPDIPYWICQCDCGRIKTVQGANLKRTDGEQTVSCGCFHQSKGEKKIIEILQKNNIEYIEQYSFVGLPKSRYDFAIIKDGQIVKLVEFDGEQHFKDVPGWGGLELQQKRDKIKNDFAKEVGIPLTRIPYWQLDKMDLQMIMG